MSVTQAHSKASVRYNQKQDNIMLRPSKDNGALIRKAAAKEGKSIQRYILDIVLPITIQELEVVDQGKIV